MKSSHLSAALLIAVAIASPASADVTLKQKSTGTGMAGAAGGGETTQYIKGAKMRSDTTVAGSSHSTIIDAAGRQMIVLMHDKKEAEIVDMAKISESLAKVGVGEIKSVVTPTGQTRQIAGSTCTVYDVKIAAPMEMGTMKMTMVLSGPYCLVKNGPGQADFAAFSKAAAEAGMFMDQSQGKAQPGIAKAMTELNRKLGELGVPFASETNIGIEADGPMAAMMKKMNNGITMEVTSVSTAAIPDAMFEIPAGYKVKR